MAREAAAIYSACYPGLQISLEDAPETVPVHGQAQLLQKMLLELLINANDACRQGGEVHRKILRKRQALHPDSPSTAMNRRKVQLAIEDGGSGLPEG